MITASISGSLRVGAQWESIAAPHRRITIAAQLTATKVLTVDAATGVHRRTSTNTLLAAYRPTPEGHT